MKKTLHLLSLLLFLCIGMNAQEKRTCQPQGEIYIRPYAEIDMIDPPRLAYALAENKHFSIEHCGFGVLTDYSIRPWFNAGLGIEVYGSHEGWTMSSMLGATDRMAWTLPVYGNFRIRLGQWKVEPFAEAQIGYAFALNKVTVLPYQDVKAKGLFWGIDVGINYHHHEFILGGKCVPMSAFQKEKDLILNICLRYAYRFRIISQNRL